MTFHCGHCGNRHDSIAEARACARSAVDREGPEPTPPNPTPPEHRPPQHCNVDMVPILYGYPTIEAHEAAQRGELVLGGCIVFDHDPQWRCPVCGRYGWDDERLSFWEGMRR